MRVTWLAAILIACSEKTSETVVPSGTEPNPSTDPTDPDLDSDGDGLTDLDEAELGTDPMVADSDADGLTDGDEDANGTDPLAADTDEDGYLDPWEVAEGSDPTDAGDGIYRGMWPYNPDKDALGGPSLGSATAAVGEMFARFTAVDQFGDEVDFYDFAQQGTPILFDISAMWCGPCNGLSSWLSDSGDTYGFGSVYPNIKSMVDSGDIRWVTLLGQDNSGANTQPDDVAFWDGGYTHESIPVLDDESGDVWSKYLVYGWPTVYFVDQDMVIQAMPDGTNYGHYLALDMANAYAPE